MNVLLYDGLPERVDASAYKLVDAKERVAYCMGCFGCWLKTPGQCVIADKVETLGSLIMQAQSVTIVSRCCYGGFSPDIKKLIDRCIPGVMPFFVTKPAEDGKREQHHTPRYENRMKLSVCFYGAHDEEEQELATKLVHANALNYWADEVHVSFADSLEEVAL